MRKFSALLLLHGLLALGGPAAVSAANVEDQVVGPIAEKTKYVVSSRGMHLATVSPRGSRVSVVVDGVTGPRFDDIVETSWGAIDPRPYANMVDPNSQPHGAAITFSRDGSRYAYLARLSQEWVLMADNKEVMRVPAGSAGNTDVRMEFTGESGKHLLFAHSVYGGYELWCDGQKWPGLYGSGGGGSEGTIDPIISSDGEHVAYVAQISRDKRALIVDGKDAGYFGTRLQYTADGKHLISLNETPKGVAVLLDGKQIFAARQLLHVYVPPAGNRLAFVLTHFNQAGNAAEGSFLVIDGKPVEATLTQESDLGKVLFSPDGKHYAALCGKTGNRFVVRDGKKGQEYFNIQTNDLSTLANGMTFSPDSSKLVYAASTSSGEFVVIDDDESDAVQGPWFRFSADGKHVAYGGALSQAQKSLVVVDGKQLALPPGWLASGFTFSPDGAHYAFNGARGGDKGIYLDGKNTETTGDFAFSPDGKHLAVVGFRAKENKPGLYVDGQLIFDSYDRAVLNRGFTPDGQHLFWMAREPATGPNATPGQWNFVVYVDGVASAHCDDISGSMQMNVRNLYGPQIGSLWRMPPAWSVNAAGKLEFLGPVDDSIKRFTVTPPADTSVDTMTATAAAAMKARSGPKTKPAAAAPANGPAASTRSVAQQASPPIATGARPATAAAPTTPAAQDPVADAATLAKAQVDAAAAKTKAFMDSLTKKKK